METPEHIQIISGIITFGFILISLIFWGCIIIKRIRHYPLLKKNSTPPETIGYVLLIGSIYFYISTPLLFQIIAKQIGYPIHDPLFYTRLLLYSNSCYIILAGIVYLAYFQKNLNAEESYSDTLDDSKALIETEIKPEEPLQETVTEWGNPLSEKIKIGIYGFFIAFLPVILMLFSTFSLRSEDKLNPLLKIVNANSNLQTFITVGILAVILAPLIEELIFRVIIQGFLVTKLRVNGWIAIVFTALLFSRVHGNPDSFAILPLALVLGVIYYWTRSYLSVVVTHACFNFYNLVIMAITIFGRS